MTTGSVPQLGLEQVVNAVLAETNDLLPTRHYEQCEAMTALGRATWMPCRCRERQAARQAAAALRAAGHQAAMQCVCQDEAVCSCGMAVARGYLYTLADKIEVGSKRGAATSHEEHREAPSNP